MVPEELAVGLSTLFAKFTSLHPFRWPVHGSPPVAVLRAFTPMIRMQVIARPVAL